MKESQISAYFMKRWKDVTTSKIWYHRVADPTGNPIGDYHKTATRALDYVVCLNGHFVAIEWKNHCTIKRGFPLKNFRLSQRNTIKEIENANGRAFFFIHTKIDGEKGLVIVNKKSWEQAMIQLGWNVKSIDLSLFPSFILSSHAPALRKTMTTIENYMINGKLE